MSLVVSMVLNIWPIVRVGHLHLVLIIPVWSDIIWILLRYDTWLTCYIPKDLRCVLINSMTLNWLYLA